MSLKDDVIAGVDGVLAPDWKTADGRVVPETKDIVLRDGAVNLQATYLYADMADSTGLAQGYRPSAVAKAIRCYLNAASRLIRARGGEVRSFDGDRVMGIFIGDSKNSNAVKAAMNITWAVERVINPALKAKWSDFKWTMRHGVGIETGAAMLVRGGIHGDNDIVSIGAAPNIAAKLSELRGVQSVYISKTVYDSMSNDCKFSKEKNMWTALGTQVFGGKTITYLGTTYHWVP